MSTTGVILIFFVVDILSFFIIFSNNPNNSLDFRLYTIYIEFVHKICLLKFDAERMSY